MNRNILLIEPNYQNKYPPMGLMKISTYHRLLHDKVTFFKGDLEDFVISNIANECIQKLIYINNSIDWKSYLIFIKNFIKTKRKEIVEELPIKYSKDKILLMHCLFEHSDFYRKKIYRKYPIYDRVYVTTLFTFYWNITIKTINFSKYLVKDNNELYVGGVMASLLTKEIKKETGIKPIVGLLDRKGMLDKNSSLIIDELPLDYSILDEINYKYPASNAYFAFMTKGCKRKCKFCSVPKIEPIYKPKISHKNNFELIREQFGEQKDLLLMDNNILASQNFEEIIKEIKYLGFTKGSTYREPDQLEISIRNLKLGFNDKAYIKKSFQLIHNLFKHLKKEVAQEYYNILDKYNLTFFEKTTKKNLINAYPELSVYYSKYRSKSPKLRYVDFNQGVDCRYITEERMKLISEIPIRPLRIAFDYIGLKKQYIYAVELAAKYGIKELSNYILYNFIDSPEELYERLKINIKLGEKLGIHIYSFPMKYIPLYGEEAKNRNYIGPKWNKKFIRAVQSILNVTKGIVAPGRSFFEKAFGKDINQYFDLLYLPETFIVYRKVFETLGYTQQWYESFKNLSVLELIEAKQIIDSNKFNDIASKTNNRKILNLLSFYLIKREDVQNDDKEFSRLKIKLDNLINNDNLLELTLTYDSNKAINH